ncbi:MAG: AAA family ATPase [Euryarchaeota archaeon]|nr:AAA family ATPase [Euryarchaeota archaeon]
MIIAISGLPGSGTSTVSGILSERLGIDVVSAGDIFRRMAEERSLSLKEFGELATDDANIDQQIDRFQKEIASDARDAKKDIILESRLSAWITEPDLAIFITASLDIRAARVAHREKIQVSDAIDHIKEREACEAGRYENYYGIDIGDMRVYDLVINSGKWNQHGVAGIILAAIHAAP